MVSLSPLNNICQISPLALQMVFFYNSMYLFCNTGVQTEAQMPKMLDIIGVNLFDFRKHDQ